MPPKMSHKRERTLVRLAEEMREQSCTQPRPLKTSNSNRVWSGCTKYESCRYASCFGRDAGFQIREDKSGKKPLQSRTQSYFYSSIPLWDWTLLGTCEALHQTTLWLYIPRFRTDDWEGTEQCICHPHTQVLQKVREIMRAYREGHTPGQELELVLQVTSKSVSYWKSLRYFLHFSGTFV